MMVKKRKNSESGTKIKLVNKILTNLKNYVTI